MSVEENSVYCAVNQYTMSRAYFRCTEALLISKQHIDRTRYAHGNTFNSQHGIVQMSIVQVTNIFTQELTCEK